MIGGSCYRLFVFSSVLLRFAGRFNFFHENMKHSPKNTAIYLSIIEFNFLKYLSTLQNVFLAFSRFPVKRQYTCLWFPVS